MNEIILSASNFKKFLKILNRPAKIIPELKKLFDEKSVFENVNNPKRKIKKPSWKIYQAYARIYLDEYKGQKEIRKNWFEKNHDVFKHIYTRFLHRK